MIFSVDWELEIQPPMNDVCKVEWLSVFCHESRPPQGPRLSGSRDALEIQWKQLSR